jgi:hypothetical protein
VTVFAVARRGSHKSVRSCQPTEGSAIELGGKVGKSNPLQSLQRRLADLAIGLNTEPHQNSILTWSRQLSEFAEIPDHPVIVKPGVLEPNGNRYDSRVRNQDVGRVENPQVSGPPIKDLRRDVRIRVVDDDGKRSLHLGPHGFQKIFQVPSGAKDQGRFRKVGFVPGI